MWSCSTPCERNSLSSAALVGGSLRRVGRTSCLSREVSIQNSPLPMCGTDWCTGMEDTENLSGRGVDVGVGTPQRLLDHLAAETVKLEKCRTLVLDEADVLLGALCCKGGCCLQNLTMNSP